MLTDLADALDPRVLLAGPPDGPDWTRCADLPAELPDRIAALAARNGGEREVAASFLVHWYAGTAAAPVVAGLARHRRVLLLDPETTWVRARLAGWFDALSVEHAEVLALPGDPSGTWPTDLAGLRAGAVEVVTELLAPVVAVAAAEVRLGPTALWGAVANACGRTFLRVADLAGDPLAGPAEADAYFDLHHPPLRARPGWQRVHARGRTHVLMRSRACCLDIRLSGQTCQSCPFTTDTDRAARLLAELP